MWKQNIVITDLETSGLNPNLHEIIEIGAIKVSQPDLRVLGWMNVKVQMDHPEFADKKALEVNGYTPEAWVDAISQQDAMQQYAAFADGCVFAAYNVTFDWGFIDATMMRQAVKNSISYHRLDLLSLAYELAPKFAAPGTRMSYINLKAACGYFQVKPEPAVHRAAVGALTALRVFRSMRCHVKPEHLKVSEAELDVLEKEIMTPSTPRPDDAEEMSRIGDPADWAAAHKAAEEILKPDEIEFT
jgi:DNA polymerase III subunit epsilon